MIRAALMLGVCIAAAGCAQLSQLTPGRTIVVSSEADDGPTMQVTIPALGASGFFTPAAQNDGVVTWRTADNTTLSFRQGVIVATRGLGDDLMSADVEQSLAASRGNASDWAPRIHNYLNPEYQSVFMAFQCRRTATTRDSVQVGDRSVRATRTDETCLNDERQIENTYWRNSNGVMVKSRQWVSPRVGYMETERVIR